MYQKHQEQEGNKNTWEKVKSSNTILKIRRKNFKHVNELNFHIKI